MRQKLLTGLLAVGVLVGLAGKANADFNIQTGLKWVPLRYTHPIGATANAPGTLPSQTDMYGWQTTSLDNYLAFFFTEQVGIQLSLDFGYGSTHADVNGMNGADVSYTQFGFAIGGKFYLNVPTRERVSPYLYVDLFKYFASISTNNNNVNNDQAGYIASFNSPVGFNLAFGAEYFFTTSFSLGAEVLGIRFAYISGSFQDMAGDSVNYHADYVSFYTGVTLNYRFLATASVHTYEEEEDRTNPRPKRKPRRQPTEETPPPETPPPTPESVD